MKSNIIWGLISAVVYALYSWFPLIDQLQEEYVFTRSTFFLGIFVAFCMFFTIFEMLRYIVPIIERSIHEITNKSKS